MLRPTSKMFYILTSIWYLTSANISEAAKFGPVVLKSAETSKYCSKRNISSKFCMMNALNAYEYCSDNGGRLPTAREYAEFAKGKGAGGIYDTTELEIEFAERENELSLLHFLQQKYINPNSLFKRQGFKFFPVVNYRRNPFNAFVADIDPFYYKSAGYVPSNADANGENLQFWTSATLAEFIWVKESDSSEPYPSFLFEEYNGPSHPLETLGLQTFELLVYFDGKTGELRHNSNGIFSHDPAGMDADLAHFAVRCTKAPLKSYPRDKLFKKNWRPYR